MGESDDKKAGKPGGVSENTPPTLQMPLSARRLPRFGVVDDRGEGTTLEDPQRYVFADGGRDEAEIGRGGIGRVLLAFDRHLHREVAIKELRGDVTGQTQVARFLREARITGQLEHPGVVPVYELAHRADGSLYYGMRLVRGRTLRLALEACEGRLERRLQLLPHFVALCQTVAYAHSRGVIHRDIKPTNVMIGEFGETVLLDWGIAGSLVADATKAPEPHAPGDAELTLTTVGASPPIREGGELGGEAGLTQEGDFLGTPSYVSPEQAQGDPSVLTGCGDVWSLGAVLYELLTGRPPFVDETITGLLHKLMEDPVIPPNQLEPRIPADLSSICLKALARDRAARYADPRELAVELEAFRDGRRVLAHDYTPWEHLVRFAVQKKGLLAAILAVLVVVFAALVVVSLSWRAERTARGIAQTERLRAETDRSNAEADRANAELARAKERRERLRAGLHFAQGAAEKADRLFSQRRWLSSRIYAAAALVHNPAQPGGPLADASFAGSEPEAAELALASRGRELVARTRAVMRLSRILRHPEPLQGVALSPDGARLFAVTKGGRLIAWDFHTGAGRFQVPAHTGGAWAVAVTPDGRRVATVGKDGRLRLFSTIDGAPQGEVAAHEGDVFSVAISPLGDQVVTGGADGRIRLWRLSDLSPGGVLEGNSGAIHGVAFSPDGRRVASAGRDRAARVWTLSAPAKPLVIGGHDSVVRHVAFSPDGRRLVTASYDKTVHLHDSFSGDALGVLSGHEDEVLQVGFAPDGAGLFSASWDRTIRIWDTHGVLEMVLEGHQQAVWAGAFAPDGRHLVTASEDGTVRVWERVSLPPSFREPAQGYLWSVVHSPDGRTLATAGADGTVRLWDVAGGTLLRRLEGASDLVAEVAISPDGRRLAAAGYDGKIRLHDLTGAAAPTVLDAGAFVRSVAFSPDGRTLVSGGDGGRLLLWSIPGGAAPRRFEVPGAAIVRRVAFSPDGQVLAAACGDGRVRLFHPTAGQPPREVTCGAESVNGLAFSPDGLRLAATGGDGVLYVFAPATGVMQARWRRNDQGLYTVRWSKDGRWLLTTGDDAVVTVWDAKSGEPCALFCLSQSVMAADFSPDGRRLVMADSDVAITVPFESVGATIQPPALLDEAQRAAGLRLEGFHLVPPR